MELIRDDLNTIAMKKLLLFFFILPWLASAQKPIEAQKRAINHFLDGYNHKDYKEMQGDFNWLMKIFLSKKVLAGMFGSQYQMYGPARMVSVRASSERSVWIEIVYAIDTTERQKINFYFTKRNKIIGLTIKQDKFQYLKSSLLINTSEHSRWTKIDSTVQLKSASEKFSGCVLAIDEGKVIYKDCIGYSNREDRTKLNDSSVFELASCSKQFTAMAIMILMEQGKLNYDDDVKKYIPDFPYKNVSVKNLLTHTSGLPDYLEMLDEHWDKRKFASNYDIVKCFNLYRPKIRFKPGKRFEYSNTGYALLSLIIERASGIKYGDFLCEYIFKPLGMNHSRVYNTRRTEHELIPNYAIGYVWSDSLKKYLVPDSLPEYDYVKYMDGITGDGTVNSTIIDLIAWERGLRENKLVKKETIKHAFAKYKLRSGETSEYGFGWFLQLDPQFEAIAFHTGSWPGYRTLILHFIDKDRCVVILSNNEYLNIAKFGNKIASVLAGIR